MVVFGILIVRLWFLQIMEGATKMDESKKNQTRTIKISAPRGIFYDRNGLILVSNRISHNVSVVPEDIKDKPEVLSLLSGILKISEADLKEKIKPNPKHPISPYQYIPIAKDLDPDTVIKLREAKLDLPGVEVDEVPIRFYPYGEFASHLFGYIREINEEELSKFKDRNYQLGDTIGKFGLERSYEESLRGTDGGKVFEVDILGRPLRQLEFKDPKPGNNLSLTIDQKIQAVAEKALDDELKFLQKYSKYKNARSGAVLALDPRNGNILAMASKPGFDPNIFVGTITTDEAQKLFNNKLYPLTNRAIQGEFAPGSTFKPITVFSALMENKVTPTEKFYCNGYDPIWGKKFKCWVVDSQTGPKKHGAEAVDEGLKNSCNIVMAELGRRVGPDALARYSRFFGLGKPTGINLYPNESSGFVPDTAWKQKAKHEEWYPMETGHFSIGQGFLTVTPIQLAQVYAAIANNGKVYRPRIVSRITEPNGRTEVTFKPQLILDLKISKDVKDIIQKGLEEVVAEGGTASGAFQGFPLNKYPVAGKTGTVQRTNYDNNAVFACYAPSVKPQIVVVVFIEQGGSGSGAAAPVARKILEAYFNVNQKPVIPIKEQPSSSQTTPASQQQSDDQSSDNQSNDVSDVDTVNDHSNTNTKPPTLALPSPAQLNTENQ